jgi:hypothetical protein
LWLCSTSSGAALRWKRSGPFANLTGGAVRPTWDTFLDDHEYLVAARDGGLRRSLDCRPSADGLRVRRELNTELNADETTATKEPA